MRLASVASHTPGGSRSSTSISAFACASSATRRTAHLALASRLTGSTTLVRIVISHHTGSLSIVISLYIIALPYFTVDVYCTSICTLLYGSIGTVYHPYGTHPYGCELELCDSYSLLYIADYYSTIDFTFPLYCININLCWRWISNTCFFLEIVDSFL